MLLHAVKSAPSQREIKSFNGHSIWFGKHRTYKCDYTERQLRIIAGEHVEHLMRAEITKLLLKAEALEDDVVEKTVSDLYDDYMHPKEERKYTKDEALDVLDKLDKEYEDAHK